MTREEAQALAKDLNWEPPGHCDFPGHIPSNAWSHWRVFETLALQPIKWRKVDQLAWREAYATDWSPEFEVELDGQVYLLIQHVYHGFPDPPEWALHVMDSPARTAHCLGRFDYLPVSWRETAK